MTDHSLPKSFKQWIVGIAVLLIIALPLIYEAIVVPLPPRQQAEASLAMIGLAVFTSFSRPLRPLIIFLSCFASMRYFYWRISSTMSVDTPLSAVVSVLLLAAESYGLLILFLGYFQTLELVERTPPPVNRLPNVDILIPTYNEAENIIRRTLIGALAVDYSNKTVYVLDDGRRPDIEMMVKALGGFYITRSDNSHAKAGNLNHALALTQGELIAIFDADHVPVRGFLKRTVGFFDDSTVALVQTAQHFFNPDPFERNLNLAGKVAPEQHFFYHVIQPGNDFWNSAFFCGSCAVLRRSALETIGGFKTQTVTEDAHTALELHSRGYRSVYLRQPLAAGLATEAFAAHVKQRMRWARGMAQILRLDCPLFKKGLSLPQRLSYFNAMLHFFFGVPRLILISAPLTYLFLGAHPLKANATAVIAYILPHIGLSTIANSKISRQFRHSFWAAVYEVSIAPYTAGVTALAVLNPKLGKFNVTEKGTHLDKAHFDLETSWITVLLLGLSLAGLVIAFPLRLIWFSYYGGDPAELDSILLNSLWALANVITLIAAVCVAFEQPQQRAAPRIKRNFPCEILWGEERLVFRTADLSETGARVTLDRPRPIPRQCRLLISSDFGVYVELEALRARSDWSSGGQAEAAFAFTATDAATHQKLVQIIFSGDEGWAEQAYPKDRVLYSVAYLLTTFWRATKPRKCGAPQSPPIRGRWRSWYGACECECVEASGTGAVITFCRGHLAPKSDDGFCLEIQRGAHLFIRRASMKPVSENQFAVEFHWQDSLEEKTFWENLYAAKPFRRPTWQREHW